MDRRGWMAGGFAWALGGCGFRPLYGDLAAGEGTAQDQLAAIAVLNIPERSGQLLRQALMSRFERDGASVARRYDLSVQFGLSGEAIGIQRDSSSSRVRLVGTARWWLFSGDAQRRTLASGSAREVDAYNVINQQFFASDLQNSAVQRRMAGAIAEQIAVQLAGHFQAQSAL